MRGKYYVIEGIDGSGKSTQATFVTERLVEIGREAIQIREPGSTPLADAIRHILLENRGVHLSPTAEALLFYAARTQLKDDIITPALEQGIDVVSDRNHYSTMAYQTVEKGKNGITVAESRALARIAMRDLVKPDLAVLLDVPYDDAIKRETGELDKIEGRGEEFFNTARQKYLRLAKRIGMIVVDGTRSIEEVRQDVFRAFEIA